MNRRFRLATVLRVRRVQEDQAQAAVMRARAILDEAIGAADASELAVREHVRPEHTAASWVAASAVGVTLAADASRARARARSAETGVTDALAVWADARGARRGVERLEERHAAEVAAEDLRLAQRELDDRGRRP